jgi:ribosomal protein S12 methylthiotransferase accessory factor
MLALAGKDLDQAQQWIDWTIEMNASIFTPARNHAYRCLQTLVNFMIERDPQTFTQYQNAFSKMYGKDCVDEMWQYANGEKTFFGLADFVSADELANNNLEQFAMHQKLLAVYHKLHQAML